MTIQFRRRGAKIEVLRAKYDPIRKRGVTTSLGRMSAYTAEIPAALKAVMEPDEVATAERWEREARAVRAQRDKQISLDVFAGTAREFAAVLDGGEAVTGDQLKRWREALTVAGEALRRAERRHAAATNRSKSSAVKAAAAARVQA